MSSFSAPHRFCIISIVSPCFFLLLTKTFCLSVIKPPGGVAQCWEVGASGASRASPGSVETGGGGGVGFIGMVGGAIMCGARRAMSGEIGYLLVL